MEFRTYLLGIFHLEKAVRLKTNRYFYENELAQIQILHCAK